MPSVPALASPAAVLSVTTGVFLIAARGSGSVFRKKDQPADPGPPSHTGPTTTHFQRRSTDPLQGEVAQATSEVGEPIGVCPRRVTAAEPRRHPWCGVV